MDNWKLLAGVIGGTLVLVVGMAFVFSGEETAKLVDQAFLVGSARHEKSFGSEEVVMENTTDEITATDSAEASESAKAAIEKAGGKVELVESK